MAVHGGKDTLVNKMEFYKCISNDLSLLKSQSLKEERKSKKTAESDISDDSITGKSIFKGDLKSSHFIDREIIGNVLRKPYISEAKYNSDAVLSTSERFSRLFWYKPKAATNRIINWSSLNGQCKSIKCLRRRRRGTALQISEISTIEKLMLDDFFLDNFFSHYMDFEDRSKFATVCHKWKNILYNPKFWINAVAVWDSKKLNRESNNCRKQFFQSVIGRSIDSIYFRNTSDEDIINFVSCFPQSACFVKCVSVMYSPISDRGFEILMQCLCNVTQLELIGCNMITPEGFWSYLNPKIISITFSDCINVTNDCLVALNQILINLCELSLQAYHITDVAMSYFTPHQRDHLRILKLISCWDITNQGIMNFVQFLPNLSVLSLSGCSKITDEGVEIITEFLKNLRHLDLSWCPRLTDACLESIACDLVLEELRMDRCVNITDVGIGYLATMSSLRKLFLRWCIHVKDFGVKSLSVLKNLEVLSLAGCIHVTTTGILSLTHLRHLEELELTNCPASAPELIECFKEVSPLCTMDVTKLVVILLDETQFEVLAQPCLLTEELLDLVATHCAARENQYFGLAYLDEFGHYIWLQNERKVLEHEFPNFSIQPIILYFLVKYYVESVSELFCAETVELFYLQAKTLNQKGLLEVDTGTACRLAALSLQISCGDFVDEETARTKLSHLHLLPNEFNCKEFNSVYNCESRVIELYKKLNGKCRGNCILSYLNLVEIQATYGVHYYKVKDKNNQPLYLGISHRGICQYDLFDKKLPHLQLENLYFRDCKFSIEVHDNRRVIHVLSSFNLYEDAIENSSFHRNDDLLHAITDSSTQVSVSRRTLAPGHVNVYPWFAETQSLTKAIWSMAVTQYQFYLDRKHKYIKHGSIQDMPSIAHDLSAGCSQLSLSSSNSTSNLSQSSSITSIGQTNSHSKVEYNDNSSSAQKEVLKALQNKKKSLEMRLNEKLEEMKLLCYQEAELVGQYPTEMSLFPNESLLPLKKKVGARFVLPDSVLSHLGNLSANEDLTSNLEVDCEMQKRIVEALQKLCCESHASRTVCRQRKKQLHEAQRRLQEKEQLLTLCKRQLQKPKKKPRPLLDIADTSNYYSNIKKSSFSSFQDASELPYAVSSASYNLAEQRISLSHHNLEEFSAQKWEHKTFNEVKFCNRLEDNNLQLDLSLSPLEQAIQRHTDSGYGSTNTVGIPDHSLQCNGYLIKRSKSISEGWGIQAFLRHDDSLVRSSVSNINDEQFEYVKNNISHPNLFPSTLKEPCNDVKTEFIYEKESPLLEKMLDVPLEIPCNQTVICASKWQPYREELKAFEMSDFYKYSTRFRGTNMSSDNNIISKWHFKKPVVVSNSATLV